MAKAAIAFAALACVVGVMLRLISINHLNRHTKLARGPASIHARVGGEYIVMAPGYGAVLRLQRGQAHALRANHSITFRRADHRIAYWLACLIGPAIEIDGSPSRIIR